GGTTATEGDRELRPEQMTSTPMRAFLEGLREPGLWGTEPVSVDFGSFMSSVTRTFSTASASPEEIGRNLAVVSREYMNLNLRLGYHFNIIDAYVVENINDNYAYFRFLGGVSEFTRRSRRARLIAEILEREGFRVEVRGDLVVGRIKKLNQEAMKTRMKLLGALVAYTRQLDVQLESDDQLSEFVEDFERRSAVLKPINLQERGRQP
ncbi:MAG: pyruvate, water dikinase, partial [Syntrophobacteraceae bacterium CG07_land_8_20_14_0_80_61_8]